MKPLMRDTRSTVNAQAPEPHAPCAMARLIHDIGRGAALREKRCNTRHLEIHNAIDHRYDEGLLVSSFPGRKLMLSLKNDQHT